MSGKIHFVIHVIGYQAQQQMLTTILYFWHVNTKQIEKENLWYFAQPDVYWAMESRLLPEMSRLNHLI